MWLWAVCAETERSGWRSDRAEQQVALAASEAAIDRERDAHRAALAEREQQHAHAIAELADTRTLRLQLTS